MKERYGSLGVVGIGSIGRILRGHVNATAKETFLHVGGVVKVIVEIS
jgi:hypothetical protein